MDFMNQSAYQPERPPYQPLAKLFYRDPSPSRFEDLENRARDRLLSPSTFRTGLTSRMGELFVAVPRELTLLMERVLRLERKVSQGYRDLPGIAQDAIVTSFVADEVVSSNDLEGVRSTRRQVIDSLRADGTAEGRTADHRFGEFAKLYKRLESPEIPLPQTPDEIRRIYDLVMDGETLGDSEPDGRLFRKDDVDIIGTGGRIIHSGVSGEGQIVRGIESMLAFASDPEVPALISAIASHFIFEYLHPFYDGNGRCGRFLLALYLSRPLSLLTSLSLSKVLAEHRDAYYRSFREVEKPQNKGELTFFVMNVLEDINEAQHRVIEELDRSRSLLTEAQIILFDPIHVKELTKRGSRVLLALFQLELFGGQDRILWSDIASYLQASKPAVRKTLSFLEEGGYVRKMSLRPLSFGLTDRTRAWLGISRQRS